MAAQSAAEEHARPQSGPVFLTCHLLANALLITYVALCHTFTHPPHFDTGWEAALAQHQVFLEAVLLTLPGWLLGVGLGRLLPRTGVVLGAIAITLTPVLYYADLNSYLIVGARLFSRQMYEILFSIRPWLSDFTTLTSFSRVVWAAVVWAAVEVVSLVASRWLSRRTSGELGRGRRLAAAAAVGVLVLPVVFRLVSPRAVLADMHEHSDRHPICATALVDSIRLEEARPADLAELRVKTHLLAHQSVANDFKKRYAELAATGGPEHPLDVVLVVAESLRYDAFGPKASPNLWELKKESISSQLHFPGGDTSYIGFQTLLFGFDPAYSIFEAGDWPPAFTRLLGQRGYYRAFVGTGGFWREMDRFLNSINFDFYRLDMTFPYYERDRKVVEQAAEILDRKGQFRELEGKPVFVLLYLHSTHYSYHSAPEDQVFTPAADDPVPAPPWKVEDLPQIRNRYRNSVHAVDRIVAPLLDRGRILVICGDHGETFGEDGRAVHGTALSRAQTTTPLLVHVPGAEPAELAGPTCNLDVLPTVLAALGISVSDPTLLAGRSLLDPARVQAPRAFMLRDLTTQSCALVGTRSCQGDTMQAFHFDLDLFEPRFTLLGLFDEKAEPVPAAEARSADLVAEMDLWLQDAFAGHSGAIAEDPVPELIALFETSTPKTRRAVLEVLAALGPRAAAAVPTLEACLAGGDDWELHREVAATLVAIRSAPEPVAAGAE